MKPFPKTKLEVSALSCTRGGRPVFADVSFSVTSGELLSVTGPNGAGKSSLLRILAGLLQPVSGTVLVTPGGDEAASIHYFGHMDGLKDAMSLRENLVFWTRLYSQSVVDEAIPAAADRFRLAHALDLPVAVLSAGQRRRAGLARINLSPRPVWLLDEPTSALDKDGEGALGELMRDHLTAGGIIIAATHLTLPVAANMTLEMAPA